MIQWINITRILYGIIVCLIKLSILLQIQRIFVPNRSSNLPLFVAIQSIMWSILFFYFGDTIFKIATCNPRERLWNSLMKQGHCYNSVNRTIMATGIFNVVSDFSILFVPMVPIWNLQLPLKKKIQIFAIFATGTWYVLFFATCGIDSSTLKSGCNNCAKILISPILARRRLWEHITLSKL